MRPLVPEDRERETEQARRAGANTFSAFEPNWRGTEVSKPATLESSGAALEHEREILIEILGEVMAHERHSIGEMFKNLEGQADRLNGQVEKMRAAFVDERGQVIDLPASPLTRRVN